MAVKTWGERDQSEVNDMAKNVSDGECDREVPPVHERSARDYIRNPHSIPCRLSCHGRIRGIRLEGGAPRGRDGRDGMETRRCG